MTVRAFEGPAGSGKTHRLMDELAETLQAAPLLSHQRVLALTFYHGSRRRLDDRLRGVPGLGRQFEAATIDSYAWRIVQRWRHLAISLGHAVPVEGAFRETCALAAALLERPAVRAWVDMSFPVVLVDEAQDLGRERSSMIATGARSSTTLLAFDEFQCLDMALLPIAVHDWLSDFCEATTLAGSRRTNDNGLLNAAQAVRDGRGLTMQTGRFEIIVTPAPGLVAWHIAHTINRRGQGEVAILTPSRRGNFANNAVARVSQGPIGRRPIGPYGVAWENDDPQEFRDTWNGLGLVDGMPIDEALEHLLARRDLPCADGLRQRLTHARSVTGISQVSEVEMKRQLARLLSARKHHGRHRNAPFSAMSIQQAKNREFDDVVVIWPYTVPDNPEQKRRLLYNAITRAKRSCIVLLQSEHMLPAPPFSVGAHA